MYCRATILRPLRSKRAMISPVRPRANASGLTRIRVRSTKILSLRLATLTSLRFRFDVRALDRDLGGDGRLFGRLRPPAAAGRLGWRGLHLRLAVRAQLPGRVDRLAARVAALLQLAHAARAAQVVGLDLVVAVRAQLVVELRQPRLGGRHLELAQAHV